MVALVLNTPPHTTRRYAVEVNRDGVRSIDDAVGKGIERTRRG